MDRKSFEQRIRQLLAVDKNAFEIYSDLAKKVENCALSKKLLNIAEEENHHRILAEEILMLLK